MVQSKSRQHAGQPDLRSRDKSSEGPDSAGAFGKETAEVRTDTSAGLSGDKGVKDVGDPAMPTGTGGGLIRGQESEIDVMTGRDRTLAEQLHNAGFNESEQPQAEGEPAKES